MYYTGKTVEVTCYIDQLLDNEDDKMASLFNAWLIVPEDWAVTQVKKQGFDSLEHFFSEYTWDDTDQWIEMAIEDRVLLGVGAGRLPE